MYKHKIWPDTACTQQTACIRCAHLITGLVISSKYSLLPAEVVVVDIACA